MNNEEKTALDIIYSLPLILKKLESKIDVIDNNVKILNNKIKAMKDNPQTAQLIQPQTQIEQNTIIPKEEPKLPRAEAPDKLPQRSQDKQPERPIQQKQVKLVLGNKKVYGHIKTTSMKPVNGASIKIFDETDNSLVKDLNSDKDGFWECRLPAGKFNCEIHIGGMKLINRSFDLKEDTKEFEVK